MIALLLVMLQARPLTVGDTIWVRRTVQVPPQSTVRPADWDPPDPIESLGRPRVILRDVTADVIYPIAVWRPGVHRVEIPGPLVLGPGGTVDSLPPEAVTVTVTSVLPDVPADSPLAPQPRAELVPRRTVSLIPALVLWAAAALLLLPLHLWWRRRGKSPVIASLAPPRPEPPVERWAEAGEQRAVAALAVARVRAAVAHRVPGIDAGADTDELLARAREAQPAWPLDETRDLLAELDRARFGWTPAGAVLDLFGRAVDLERRLLQEKS